MKKMMLTLMVMVTMTISAQAMSYSAARNEALFWYQYENLQQVC